MYSLVYNNHCLFSLLSPHCDHSPNRGNTPIPGRSRHASEMSNPEIARYLEKEHLKDAEENDYHLMEGLIKQHRQQASNTIDIPIPIATSNDHVSCNPYNFGEFERYLWYKILTYSARRIEI